MSRPVLFEEGNVFIFELNGLFCIIPTPFHSILPDSEEVIKSDQGEVPNSMVEASGRARAAAVG